MKIQSRTMKILCSVFAIIMLMSCMIGCSTKQEAGKATAETSTSGKAQAGTNQQPAADTRKQKDTLIVAKNEDITSLDPAKAINQKSFSIYGQIYEGLVWYNTKTKTVDPCLATEWKQLDDLNWRFTLRENVKFHNGETMTSEDVVYSFERIMNSGVASSYVDYIEKIVADGDNAVIITVKMPYAQIVQALTYPAAMIVSKKAVEEAGDDFAQNPVGTGAYKFVERFAADSITLVAFDEYWGEKAKTKNLIFKVIPEGSQRTIMLENGEADIICDVLANDAARIAAAKDLNLINETGYKYYAIYFKCDSKTPVGNKQVRQAMEYAINKQALVDAVMSGYAEVGSLLCTPPTIGYNKTKDRGELYDPEKAKQMLADAGYPNGFDLEVFVRTGQVYEEIATILQDQFAAVGINININVLDSAKIDEKFYGGEEVPIRLAFYNNICGDTDFIMQKLLPTTYGQVYFNDDMVDLIERARSEVDLSKRQAIYDEFHDLMAEDVPQISMFYEEILMGMNANVEGFELNPLGKHLYSTVIVYE